MSIADLTKELRRGRSAEFANLWPSRLSPQRIFDVVVSGLLAVLLSPIIVLVMAAIWLESGRPFLFSQVRIGQFGKPFRMHKFRKFYQVQSANGCPLTVKNDTRMTPVGRVLERLKLDELPQLWNVLCGEMSLVGPRPESTPFADCFEQGLRQVLDYRPGIMGPSQALFRRESSLYPAGADPVAYYRAVLFPIKARLDLAYYPGSTVASSIGWIVRCALATVGCATTCPANLIARIETGHSRGSNESRRNDDLVRLLVAERESQLRPITLALAPAAGTGSARLTRGSLEVQPQHVH